MTKPLELEHVDTCLPDFWSGHRKAHVMIPVHKDIHLSEVKRLIKSELAQGAVMGGEDLAFLLSAEFVGADRDADAKLATKRAHAAVNRMQPAIKGKRRLFESLDAQLDDDCDCVYAYFVFVDKD